MSKLSQAKDGGGRHIAVGHCFDELYTSLIEECWEMADKFVFTFGVYRLNFR